jgi:dolichol-phosphate mannosyltransferase
MVVGAEHFTPRSISVVSPIFNNAGSIRQLVQRIRSTHQTYFPELRLEVILVDDGSTDESLKEIRGIMAESASGIRLRLIQLSKNFGQVSAIVAGISISESDATVVISADLQDPPELIAEMVSEWRSGAEVVIAAREDREDGLMATFFSGLSYSVARRHYREMPRGGFDYFLLSRRAAVEFIAKPGRKRFLQGDVFELGFKRKVMFYQRTKRLVGKSQWKFWKRVEYFVDLVVGSTNLPIRAATFMGFFSIFASIIYGLVVLVSWAIGSAPTSGWTPLILLSLFFGGLTVFLLGLIGEYIWRIYDEVSGRRQFIVESVQDSVQS